MKKFRKVIVALLAMVMALGCFAVTASADTTKVKVTVIWEEADGKDTSLYVWNPSDNDATVVGSWPGTQMECKDGVYTLEVDAVADKLNMIANNSLGQTDDIKDIETGKGDITITVGAKGAKNYTATVTYATANPNGGVSAPVVAAAIAVVSMVGIVVFTKRRTVAE